MFTGLMLRLFPMFLLAPDDGGGSGGAGGDGQAGQGSQNPGDTGTGGDSGTGAGAADGSKDDRAESKTGTVTMSQADLDALIDKRIGQARKGWEKDAQTKAERDKLDETERLKAEKADADKAAQDAIAKANAKLVVSDAKIAAMAAGVPAERIAAFVKLADLSDVEVDDDGEVDAKALKRAVESTLAENEFLKAAPERKKGSSGGDMNGNGGTEKPKNLEDAISARMKG